MHVTFDHREVVARGIETFWFKPERPVRYIAGQFTDLHLPHTADERGSHRWFTLSSSPTEPLLAITTKFSTEGSSFKRQLSALTPGTALKLGDPMGDFVLPKDPSIPLVFAAAGLGISPVRSMVKWLDDKGELRHITVLQAAGHEAELAFAPLFRDSNLKYLPIVKRPGTDYRGEKGSLTTERILAAAPADSLIYLSGPEQLVEIIYKELLANGIAPARLIADYFPGYTSPL